MDKETKKQFRNVILLMIFTIFLGLGLTYLFNSVSAKTTDDKLSDFDKLTDKEKTKEIYKECMMANKIIDRPKINIFGTEYYPNAQGKVFLQFINSNDTVVNNGVCLIDIFYPNDTYLINDGFMVYLNNSDGLYYYLLDIPNDLGVYMVSAKCKYPQNITTVTASNDSYVYEFFPTTNYGSQTIMYATNTVAGFETRSLVLFNVSSISINSSSVVKLLLYKTGVGFNNVSVQRITSTWLENNVTWNNKPNTAEIYDMNGLAQAVGFYSWDITDLVRGWKNGTYTNYGLLLNASYVGSVSPSYTFNTRENANFKPYIQIINDVSTIQDTIRGGGEIHVSPKLECGILNITNTTIDTYQLNISNYTINSTNYLLNLSNYTVNITEYPLTINNYTVDTYTVNVTNTTVNSSDVANQVWNYPYRSVFNATYVQNVQNTTNALNVTSISDDVIDDIALRVISYFIALKDKLLTGVVIQ
jgi:hypothetical protein